MSEQHISPEQQREIARRLHPNAFDSDEAMERFQKQVGDDLHLGHENISHADLTKRIGALTSHEHGLDHHVVAGIIEEISGIPTTPPKH